MRCVQLIPDTVQAGAELQALYLLEALAAHPEFEPELVFHAPGRLHPRFERVGTPIERLERRRRLVPDARRRARVLAGLLAREQPAILHTHLYEANAVGLLAARRAPRTRTVITQLSGTMERSAPLPQRVAMRTLYRRADRALANSRDGADLLTDLGVPADRIVLLPQGIPPERVVVRRSAAEVRAELGIENGTPMVLSVGRADQTKDYPTLMRAMEDVWAARPDARLVLVGPTPDDMREMGLDVPPRALAAGWDEQPADVMNAADVVAMSSWTEGNSNVAGEALALGRPVACTDTGDHPDFVREAGGRVVPIRSPGPLAGAILDLLERPPAPDDVRAVAARHVGMQPAIDVTLAVYRELREAS